MKKQNIKRMHIVSQKKQLNNLFFLSIEYSSRGVASNHVCINAKLFS